MAKQSHYVRPTPVKSTLQYPNRGEGYWYSPSEPKLPMPQPRKEPWYGWETFLKNLAIVEKEAFPTSYKGASPCRLCSKHYGSIEFEMPGKDFYWTWPSGLSHYVKVHFVKPSKDFRKFITATVQQLTYD